MTCWTWHTSQGVFRIERVGPSRSDLPFGTSVIGSYLTPQDAAECCGEGRHAQIAEGFDGGSLGVSRALTDWVQAGAGDVELRDNQLGVLAELRPLLRQADRAQGHLPRNG